MNRKEIIKDHLIKYSLDMNPFQEEEIRNTFENYFKVISDNPTIIARENKAVKDNLFIEIDEKLSVAMDEFSYWDLKNKLKDS